MRMHDSRDSCAICFSLEITVLFFSEIYFLGFQLLLLAEDRLMRHARSIFESGNTDDEQATRWKTRTHRTAGTATTRGAGERMKEDLTGCPSYLESFRL